MPCSFIYAGCFPHRDWHYDWDIIFEPNCSGRHDVICPFDISFKEDWTKEMFHKLGLRLVRFTAPFLVRDRPISIPISLSSFLMVTSTGTRWNRSSCVGLGNVRNFKFFFFFSFFECVIVTDFSPLLLVILSSMPIFFGRHVTLVSVLIETEIKKYNC